MYMLSHVYRSHAALVVMALVMCAFAYALPIRLIAAENIPAFDVRVTVYENATIEVVERIRYDFGEEDRHGIFRRIPYSYQAGTETYTADVTSVVVTTTENEPLPFTESRARGELTLKIGDPHETVSGVQEYLISYVVSGPFLYFENQDEFVWNVIGSWPTGIDRATVLVDLPRDAPVLAASCYQGSRGSNGPCTSDQRLVSEDREAYTATAEHLGPHEGFTVSVAFPKETITEIEQPWVDEPKPVTPYSFWPLGIPFVVLVLMVWHWFMRGRDPRGRRTIVTEFSPPDDLAPSVAGVVYNEMIEDPEISAEIVRLAVEGFIKIHRFEEKILWVFDVTEYVFEFIDSPKGTPDRVQELILERLRKDEYQGSKRENGIEVTGALLSKMKRTFAEDRKAIASRIYEELVVHKYFLARPDSVRTWYVVGGIIAIVLGIGLGALIGNLTGVLIGLGVGISGLIVSIGGVWMPVRTNEGVRVKEHLEGFRRYLDVAEKDRIQFHNPPEKTPELFDKYLPYAIAFGLEDKWAEQFEGIYVEPPEWYSGSTSFSNGFAMTALASDLGSFSDDFAQAAAPRSSSSGGGGSVGGGFGGGGGGSW